MSRDENATDPARHPPASGWAVATGCLAFFVFFLLGLMIAFTVVCNAGVPFESEKGRSLDGLGFLAALLLGLWAGLRQMRTTMERRRPPKE